MTLVLSMKPFLDPEGDPPLTSYPPIWNSERCTKTCLSNSAPACSSEEQLTQAEPHCRRLPDHVAVSKIAYFKRKFVDDDEPTFSFRTYCQTVAPVLEERAHVLRLSLEKMRFIDDPEAFLRRSVLVNNLLRRLRTEILLQSTDWCFPPNPAFATAPCILPAAAGPAHQAIHRALPTRICLAPQAGPPLRKRFRMLRSGQGDVRPDCSQTCCCIYAAAAAAGHYLHLPFSMYDSALSACPSTAHSSSFLQIASHSKLGLSVSVDDHDDEDEDADEEEETEDDERAEEDDEQRQAGTSGNVVDKVNQKRRTKNLLSHKSRKKEDSCMSERVEEETGEEEEEEEEDQVVRPCQWDSERDFHRFNFWHRRAHRQ